MSESAFLSAYNFLNPEQKKAVDTLYGPVSVIAGPGTGKTQLLTLRIANIINTLPGIEAKNILALTFTEAGVVAMRDRLRSFIGTDAYQVHITTFHGFCEHLIQLFPEKFQFAKQLRLIDDLTKNRLIGSIFLNGKWKYLYNKFDPEMYLGDTISHVSTLKREGINPADLRVRIKKVLNTLDDREDLHYKRKFRDKEAGDRKQTYFQEEDRLKKQLEWCDVYEIYESKLKEEGYYDFDDMIRLVVDRMNSDSDFLLGLQEQYQFLLVDEYQDTNSLQNSIMMHMVEGLDQPNVLVVGDDEQSIFRFQGAIMQNVIDFHHHFDTYDLTTVVLTKNYRSDQGILDASRQVVDNNQNSLQNALDLPKNLQASHPDHINTEDTKVRRYVATDERIETDYLVAEIQKLHDSGVPYGQMAVIYRKHHNANDLIEAFSRVGIPYKKTSGEYLLDHPEAYKLLQVLRLIDNIQDNNLLWEVLLYDFWKLDISHLLKVQSQNMGRGEKRWDRALYEALLNTDDMNISIVVRKICEFHKHAANMTLAGFFEYFLVSSGYREYILEQENSLELLSILDAFFTEIKGYNIDHPEASVSDFIQYLHDCQKYHIHIRTQPLKFYPDAVNLMTAHGSKGLEFEAVFMYKTTSKNWESSRKFNKLTLSVDIFDTDSLIAEDGQKQIQLEENRRLFFVAMTRAKRHLYLLSTSNPQLKQAPSQFVYEIDDLHIEEVGYTPNEEEILSLSTAPVIEKDWSEATKVELRARLDKYVLSPTALNTWLRSPREFLEKTIIRKPQAKAANMAFGTVIHSVLEAAIRHQNDTKTVIPDTTWKEVLEQGLSKEILTHVEREKLYEEGIEVFQDYFNAKGNNIDQFALSELRINSSRPVTVEGMPCSGAIDRVEYLDDHEVRVIDYKTGSVKKWDSDYGEDYERQLYFYKLLWDGLGKTQVLVEGGLDYVMHVKDGSVCRKILTYEPEKLSELREYIRLFREAINSPDLDFPEEGICPRQKNV